MQPESIRPEEVLDLIIAKVPYIDRMTVWFLREPHFDMDYLEQHCGQRPKLRNKKMRHSAAEFTRLVRYQLELFQPTQEALRYLARETENRVRYYINYVEIPLDFIARMQENVKTIRRFFDRCWVKKWHVNKRLVRIAKDDYDFSDDVFADTGTTYYSPRKATVNYVIYSDKPSKMNGMPCCHLEVRLNGHPTLRRLRLDSFGAYLPSDFLYSFWERHLTLRTVRDKEFIDESVARVVRKKKRDRSEDEIRRTIHFLLRIFRYDMYSAQVICDFGKYVNGKRRFTAVLQNDDFLPPKRAMMISKNEHKHNQDRNITNIQQTVITIPIRHKTTDSHKTSKGKKRK